MKEKNVNNAVRLAVATNCLKSKSLPPIKYPKEVIMYKFDSFLNQRFDFDMDEPIIHPRLKLEPKADVLTIGVGVDVYDFAISYLSNHDRGLLSLIVKDTGFVDESVFKALHSQGYFNHYLLENNGDTFLEKTYKCLEKYLSSPKRKKIYIFNDSRDEELYRNVLEYLDEHTGCMCDVYLDDRFEYEPTNKFVRIHEMDFLRSHAEIAGEAIGSVQNGKIVQLLGDSHILPEMKRQLTKQRVEVPELGKEANPKYTSLLSYYNTFELLNTYLNIVHSNKDALVYVMNNNFGESELISLYLPIEDRAQFFSLDVRVLWKAYFATHMI